MKSQHASSTPGRGAYGPNGGVPHPRGNPYHLEYRPKSTQQQHDPLIHSQLKQSGADGMDVNAPVFKQSSNSFHLQHTARPYNGPMGYSSAFPIGGQQTMPCGPLGGHHYQPRMRGPPRGAMQQQHQQYMPRGGMNPGEQGYYPPQMQMIPPCMMGPGQHYMGGPPMYSMPPMQDIGMGMGGMPVPIPIPQLQHQPPPKRELKILDIINPKTGKVIELGHNASSRRPSDASSTTAADDSKAASTSTTAQSTPQKKEATPVEGTCRSREPSTANEKLTPTADFAKETKIPRTTVTEVIETSRDKAVAKTVEQTVEKGSEIRKRSGSFTTVTTSKPTTQPVMEPSEKTSAVTRSAEKKMSDQDIPSLTLQQGVMEKEDEVQAGAPDTAAGHPIETKTDVSITLHKKLGGKLTYTLELLMSFSEQYKDLPGAVIDQDVPWPSMEITSEVALLRGSSRGGRNGAGWERSEKPSGGFGRQGPRSGSGGGQWARSQDLPKRSGRGERGGGRGGRGGHGGSPDPPLLDGPVKPLTRSANRWIPTKSASTLEVTKKNVNGIMNKMTREKFERLSGQLTSINMESLDMLQAVIKIIFDKAVGEPHFCDMYADLCVHLETNWKVWSFLKIVQNDDDNMFYWTAMSNSDSEVVGPFDMVNDALESADSDEFEPVPAPSNMKLSEVRIRDHKFIKVWVQEDSTKAQYYWSGQDLDDLGDDQVLNGPCENHEAASQYALKSCSFKRILLNACQEEFEKDNIYEELEKKFKKDKEEGKITSQMAADYEEKRLIMKLRMLGNIRFIGELYRKGMLQERIMHECIMKLMDVRLNNNGMLVCVHPNDPPDEESIESLAKLLTTMGKDLDKHGAEGFMPSYFYYLEHKLVKDKRLSSRITFMIKDVIELRQHRWEPRRKELKQKTLTEIRKEAEREARAPPVSTPGGSGRERGDRDHFRSDRRSNSSRDGFNNNRSTMAPVYQPSQSMSSRTNSSKQITLPRGIGARDDSVKTGPSGRPAAFNFVARQGGRGGPSGAPASFPNSRRGPGVGAKKPESPVRAKVIPPLDDETQAKIGKKAKSTAEEYVSIVDLEEAEACLVEAQKEHNNHDDVDRIFAFEILKKAIDAKAEVRGKMVEMLEKLSLGTKNLAFAGIRYAIEKTLAMCGDLWCDVPKLHEHMADFVVRFMKNSALTGVSLDWILGRCLQSVKKDTLDELIDGGFLAALLGTTLNLLKTDNVEKTKQEIRATNILVLSVLPSYKQSPKDMQEWIKKYDLEDVFLLEPAFDVVDRVINDLPYVEVVLFIEDVLPKANRNDLLFVTYTCLFILSLSKKGELPSAERVMLLLGFCPSLDIQAQLISAIFQTRTDYDEAKTLLAHLVKEGAVVPLAFNKWLTLQDDNSVSRKRVLEELGQFVEQMARTK
ncbi:unnamed protein product [Peronospora belbahrii]|uniref:MI domain-containing protein n=1 Tax=Peronospora belbahrii TaxID=622444 RepID=A0ABN8CWA8_9STRA|nr:unnamed protein product [Peronospora belbahrii]